MGLDDLRKKRDDGVSSDETGETWSPKEDGDELAGTLEAINYVFTRFGETFVLRIRDEEDKLWALWISQTVLKSLMIKYGPGVGSLVVFTYGGKSKGESGYSYNAFSFVTDSELCHHEWDAAKEAYEQAKTLADAMGTSKAKAPITAEGDDGMQAPF